MNTSFDDRAYYRKRAEECRSRAAEAIDPAVRSVHHDMASRYAAAALGGASPALFPPHAAQRPE